MPACMSFMTMRTQNKTFFQNPNKLKDIEEFKDIKFNYDMRMLKHKEGKQMYEKAKEIKNHIKGKYNYSVCAPPPP